MPIVMVAERALGALVLLLLALPSVALGAAAETETADAVAAPDAPEAQTETPPAPANGTVNATVAVEKAEEGIVPVHATVAFEVEAHASAPGTGSNNTTSASASEDDVPPAGGDDPAPVDLLFDVLAQLHDLDNPIWIVPDPAPADEAPPQEDAAPAPLEAAPAIASADVPVSAAAPASGMLVPAMAAVVVAGAAGTGFAFLPELRHLRRVFARIGLVGLYAKLSRDRMLDHRTRQDIIAHIEANPGAHQEEIRRAFDIGLGTATHHLAALEANGLVVSVKSGRRRCYFLPGVACTPRERPALAVLGSDATRRVFSLISASPGIRQRELAAQLGVTPTAVIFHARRLVETGVVRRGRVGRQVAYYPAPAA